jgi:hypothetical protein
MAGPCRHSVKPATITAAGNSGSLTNLGESSNPTVVAFLTIAGPVTNGGGVLTINIDGSPDGTNWANIGSFTGQGAATAAGVALRLVLSGVVELNIRVSWTATGSGYSYAGVDVELFMTSPDA